jgi:signal transduction histidine kinase/pSer/pThr/pTyr-binding forkhead associated (FHA) protein
VIQLDVIDGPNEGASFRAEEPSFIIGRGRTNRIILFDNKVSARHAQIECRDDAYVIRDLDSTNGTFVNGRAVKQRDLKVADEIRMGRSVLKVTSFYIPPVERASRVSISDAASEQTSAVRMRVSRTTPPIELEKPAEDTSVPTLIDAYRHLLAMYKVSGIIRNTVDIDSLLDQVLARIFADLRAERGLVMLFDDESGALVQRAFRTRTGEAGDAEMTISRSIVDQVIEKQEAVLTSDAVSDDRFRAGESIVQDRIRSAMCAPLSTRSRVLGILYVDSRSEVGTFKKSDLELLTAIGNEAGIAVENRLLRDANIKAERLTAVGQTVAELSHYIKNILSCMEAGSEIVNRALDEGEVESVRKGWGIVRRNERRISELVLDMLNYSRERTPARVECDLNNVIEDVAESVGTTAEGAAVELRLDLDRDLPLAHVDPTGLHRCLLNLISNAIDAAQSVETPTVTVVSERDGENVVLRVFDNGPGIPEDMMDRIFDIFVSTKGERGTGLGLAVVKKIVNEHAGEVTVRNQPEGGAEFRIALAIEPQP